MVEVAAICRCRASREGAGAIPALHQPALRRRGSVAVGSWLVLKTRRPQHHVDKGASKRGRTVRSAAGFLDGEHLTGCCVDADLAQDGVGHELACVVGIDRAVAAELGWLVALTERDGDGHQQINLPAGGRGRAAWLRSRSSKASARR